MSTSFRFPRRGGVPWGPTEMVPHLESDTVSSRLHRALYSVAMSSDVTALLTEVREGRESPAERLFPLLYGELRALARRRMQAERSGHTLQPTEVVHEAYLRLVGQEAEPRDRNHFLALASTAMRRVLVDHARGRGASKRGSDPTRVTLSENAAVGDRRDLDVLEVDQALQRLAELDARQARLVELRFFGGLEVEEAAAVLEVSPATAARDWRIARAWLSRELEPGGDPAGP